MLLFFFSSRRRHTRWPRDWSSDVCSSDLPLIIAAIVYGVVDRVLGLVGKYNIFAIESQAVSIMLVLMFAVLTDYSLFVFSRYREELRKNKSKYDAKIGRAHV